MNSNRIEDIPQVWDDERDGQFFRLTAAVFSPEFCLGATALLASYDTDEKPTEGATPAHGHGATPIAGQRPPATTRIAADRTN